MMNPIVLKTKIKAGKKESFWQKMMSVYNSLPGGITKCKTANDAKIYTCVLFAALSVLCIIFVAVAVYFYYSAKKGGDQ